jgi:hypothetical protein
VSRLFVSVLNVALLTSIGAAGQSKPGSIQGVWRVVEVTITGPDARTIGSPQPNLAIFTAMHYSRTEIPAEKPRQNLADIIKATADELRAVWGPFTGEAGTYEVTGNLITLRPIVAKNPAAMASGSFSTWSYKLEDNTLWVTAQRNQRGPVANPETIKLTRVE